MDLCFFSALKLFYSFYSLPAQRKCNANTYNYTSDWHLLSAFNYLLSTATVSYSASNQWLGPGHRQERKSKLYKKQDGRRGGKSFLREFRGFNGRETKREKRNMSEAAERPAAPDIVLLRTTNESRQMSGDRPLFCQRLGPRPRHRGSAQLVSKSISKRMLLRSICLLAIFVLTIQATTFIKSISPPKRYWYSSGTVKLIN